MSAANKPSDPSVEIADADRRLYQLPENLQIVETKCELFHEADFFQKA